MGALHANAYDGNLWGEFQTVNGMPFLHKPQNYGFMLNFDFFQPMKHRKDFSVRAFCLGLKGLNGKISLL